MSDGKNNKDGSGDGSAGPTEQKQTTPEELKEAMFFVEQELYEDALELLLELKREKPGLAGLDQRIAEVRAKIGPAGASAGMKPGSALEERLAALKAKAAQRVNRIASPPRVAAVESPALKVPKPAALPDLPPLGSVPGIAAKKEVKIPSIEQKESPEPERTTKPAVKPEPAEKPEAEKEPEADAGAEPADAGAEDSEPAAGEEDLGKDVAAAHDRDDDETVPASEKAKTLVWDPATAASKGVHDLEEPKTGGNWKLVVGVLLGALVGVAGYAGYQRYAASRKQPKSPTSASQAETSDSAQDAGSPAPRVAPDAGPTRKARAAEKDAGASAPAGRAARPAQDASVASRPAARQATPDAGGLPKVRLTLIVKPLWAKPVIHFRGNVYRKNRFVSPPVPPTKEKESVLIKAKGFYTRKISFVLDKDFRREVVLMERPAK